MAQQQRLSVPRVKPSGALCTVALPFALMSTGTVRFWQDHGGFGFSIPYDHGEDVFVHRTTLKERHSLDNV